MRGRYLDRRIEAELEALMKEQREDARVEALITRENPENKPKAPITPRRLGDWASLVEQRIQDAIADGAFDNLQGAGKPLNLEDDVFVPDELKMAHRMLRSSGVAPLWIEINKEIRTEIDGLSRLRTTAAQRWARASGHERERLRDNYAQRIISINEKIANHNLIAPASRVHLAVLIADEEMRTFDAAVGAR